MHIKKFQLNEMETEIKGHFFRDRLETLFRDGMEWSF